MVVFQVCKTVAWGLRPSGLVKAAGLRSGDYLSPSRVDSSSHLGTRQWARILDHCVEQLGLDSADYGTHSLRRTMATLIYRRTRISARCNFFCAIRSSSRPFNISASRSTMP